MASRLPQLQVLPYLLGLLASTKVFSFDGCTVKFGRRGCAHRVVHGVTVVCNGQNVESVVPQNIPVDTVHLTLIGFNLTQLTKSDLGRFTSVVCLTLSESRHLSHIDHDSFSGMPSLVELTLDATNISDSQLAFITHESFSNMELLAVTRSDRITRISGHGVTRQIHSLRTLDFKYCAIDYISPLVYHELRRLERLDLTGNRLSFLNWTLIAEYVTHLNSLLLAGNRFQTLPLSTYSVFYTVKELTLADNPWHCNCELGWLREFYQRSAVDKALDEVHCASPHPYRLREIDQGQKTAVNFKCVEPETPIIQWNEYDNGRRAEINCTSRGDPSPTLWLKLPDGRVLSSPPSETMADQQTTSPQLLVRPGMIICEATNKEGTSRTIAWVTPEDAGNRASSARLNLRSHRISGLILLTLLLTSNFLS